MADEHVKLKTVLLHAMGGKPHMNARPSWADFIRSESTSFWMAYDWVKRPAFWGFLYQNPDYDGGLGGVEGTTISAMSFGRVAHDK